MQANKYKVNTHRNLWYLAQNKRILKTKINFYLGKKVFS